MNFTDNLHPEGFKPEEKRAIIIPSLMTSILILVFFVVYSLTLFHGSISTVLILIAGSLFIILYLSLVFLVLFRIKKRRRGYLRWVIPVTKGFLIGFLAAIFPDSMILLVYILALMSIVRTSLIFGRIPSYVLLIIVIVLHLGSHALHTITLDEWINHLSLPVFVIVVNESVLRLQETHTKRNLRLEKVNQFARAVSTTIDLDEMLPLLDKAIQFAIKADTYFLGLKDGEDTFLLKLFFDEGEYFNDVRVSMAGSFGGWVLRNNQTLFLPDLRNDVTLDGVHKVIIGKNKESLSWLGVPMKSHHVQGIVAVASYSANAFSQSDKDLLENLTHHAMLALENAHHHAEVEHQAQTDSLTTALNHGFFLKRLQEQLSEAKLNHTSLGLIMLDVDHFKQYNDTHGHLAGDEILKIVVKTIRRHIKKTDIVGRWGGEEFAISLPYADAKQTRQVAERIRETLNATFFEQNGKQIAAPTVSQGVAVFPFDETDMMPLINIADQRLYHTKNHGRNQIYPDKDFWKA